MKKLVSLVLSFALLCAFLVPAVTPAASAADDGTLSWGKAEVERAISLGFVPDELQGNYQWNITRGEFAKIALFFMAAQYSYRTTYLDQSGVVVYDISNFLSNYGERKSGVGGAPEPFTDTDDLYVLRARQFGLVDGKSDGSFGAAGNITRQEAAAMLLRTYVAYGGEVLAEASAEPLDTVFDDAADIAPWARAGARNMWAMGVMGGQSGAESGRYFSPNGYYTREQCIVTFLRLYEKAPVSRAKENITPLITFKSAVSSITGSQNYKVLQRLDSDICTVLYVGFPTAPRTMTQLLLVYPSGETRELLMRYIPADNPGWNIAPTLQNMTLSTDKKTLTFTAVYAERKELGSVKYTVDLNTGYLKKST